MTSSENIRQLLLSAKGSLSELNKIYKSNLELVNNLYRQLDNFMIEMTNIDDGLDFTDSIDFEGMIGNIKKFNHRVEDCVPHMRKHWQEFNSSYKQAIECAGATGDFEKKLVKEKKSINFLTLFSRKFRAKIAHLKAQEKIMFSFSSGNENLRKHFHNNLRKLDLQLLYFIEETDKLTEELNKLK